MPLGAWGIDQLLKISDQVWQLRNLNVSLDHIAWVQIPNGLYKLLQSIVKLLFLIQVVCMFFGNFCYDLSREVGSSGNILCLREQSLLKKGLNLNIILHFIELKELLGETCLAWCRSQHIDGIILYFDK
jgi:hypothetical protein